MKPPDQTAPPHLRWMISGSFYEDRLKSFAYALHGLFWEEGGFFLDVLSELMLRWDIRFSHCGLLISETSGSFFWIRWSTASCWAALFFQEFPALCSLLFEVWSKINTKIHRVNILGIFISADISQVYQLRDWQVHSLYILIHKPSSAAVLICT